MYWSAWKISKLVGGNQSLLSTRSCYIRTCYLCRCLYIFTNSFLRYNYFRFNFHLTFKTYVTMIYFFQIIQLYLELKQKTILTSISKSDLVCSFIKICSVFWIFLVSMVNWEKNVKKRNATWIKFLIMKYFIQETCFII